MAARDRRSSCAGCSSSTRWKRESDAANADNETPAAWPGEARVVFRVAQLREALAAWTACEYWHQRTGGDALQYARPSSAAAAEWQLDAAVHNLRKLRRESVRSAEYRGNVGVTAGKAA